MTNQTTRGILIGFCTLLTVFALVAVTAVAQTSTTTKEVTGTKTATQHLSGTVVYNEGGTVAVKMSSGELRTVTPPPDRMVKVDGQDIPARDVKVGTKLEATITTTTRSVTERTITTGSGTVWFVNGNSVILTMADTGKNKMFVVKNDYKFNVDGKDTGVHDLRKGMKVSAEKIVEAPLTEIAANTAITGTVPAPKMAAAPEPAAAPAPAPRPRKEPAPAKLAEAAPAPASEPAPAKLPKTGSELPLVGLLGFLCTGASLGLRAVRRFR